VDEIFQAVRLNKYLDFQRDLFIHRKERKGLTIFRISALLFFAVFSTAKNKKKHLCVLRVCPVALEDGTGVSACPMKSLLHLLH
jgi:hypothetical protein